MRVLVACEFSGVVRRAFRERGHDAWSCDLLPAEDQSPFHLQQDAIEASRDYAWDLMIAHPPCTHLTIAGAAYYDRKTSVREEATAFFEALLNAPIYRIAVENPVPFRSVQDIIGRYNQAVDPFQFGDPARKRICLWLRNLPPLFPTYIAAVPEPAMYVRKSGPKAGKIYRGYFHQGKSAHERSRFFPGIAAAMAEQWG